MGRWFRVARRPAHIARLQATFWKQKQTRDRLASATIAETDQELIARAVADGRVTHCPDGMAHGALKWTPWGLRPQQAEN